MMPTRYVLTTVLGVLLTGTAGVIGVETDWGRAWTGGQSSAAVKLSAPLDTNLLPPFALARLSPSGDGYRETVERPLFVPTRRPAPAGSGAQMAMKKGQYRLAGTTVSEHISVAYLFETGTSKTFRVNKGADINGMTVDSVSATRVVLKQGDDTEELTLRISTSPRTPPPPPQQVAGGAPLPPGQSHGASPQAGVGSHVAPPGFEPPGGSFQAGSSPAVAGAPGSAPAPGVRVPGAPAAAAQDANAAATPAASDPNQPQQRRRRFQNLPQ